MILKKRNGLLYSQHPHLAEFGGIWHGIFTRNGGCSPVPYDSLNVSMGVGDRTENVQQNRRRIQDCSGGELVFTNQLHGVRVLALKKGDGSNVKIDRLPAFEGDALVTDICGKALVIKVADCQSVMMYDPVRHVIANVHSGWRGSIHNIIAKTIRTMRRKFGCNPQDILAGVGPSLGPCCCEFVHYMKEIPETFWKYRINEVHFDFWAVSRYQLFEAGVKADNIHLGNVCTKCNTDQYFSYRGEGVTGRFAAVITLVR